MAPAQHTYQQQDRELEERVAQRTCHVVHLTHNDLDAVGADAIHRMRYGEVVSVFSSVGKYPFMLAVIAGVPGNGDLLSISDLGFNQAVVPALTKAQAGGWRIEWRDHHRWKEDEVNAAEKRVDLLHLDTDRCACGIVAVDLCPDNPAAIEVARVVCDYDLWKHQDPRSAVLGQVLQKFEYREYVRDLLAQGILTDQKVEEAYEAIKREMDQMIARSIRHTRIMTGKYTIGFAPLYGYPSETAAAVRKHYNTDIEVIINGNGRFSVRSVQPISHLIARKFGGGGHPNAAGGSFPFSRLESFLYWLLKRNGRFAEFTTIAADC